MNEQLAIASHPEALPPQPTPQETQPQGNVLEGSFTVEATVNPDAPVYDVVTEDAPVSKAATKTYISSGVERDMYSHLHDGESFAGSQASTEQITDRRMRMSRALASLAAMHSTHMQGVPAARPKINSEAKATLMRQETPAAEKMTVRSEADPLSGAMKALLLARQQNDGTRSKTK